MTSWSVGYGEVVGTESRSSPVKRFVISDAEAFADIERTLHCAVIYLVIMKADFCEHDSEPSASLKREWDCFTSRITSNCSRTLLYVTSYVNYQLL
jgi:hypothetical protein